ncbi:MAG: 30S ribosome-binding factor RbfA [Planctomycetota bacterium]
MTDFRSKQIASVLREEIDRVLSRGLQDPRIRGMITITAVEVTPDLKRADVRVSVLPEEHQELTMHGLRAAARHIRREAMGRVHGRDMPQLKFVLDRGLKEQRKVLEALARAAAESPAAGPDADATGGPDGGEPGANDGVVEGREGRAAPDPEEDAT